MFNRLQDQTHEDPMTFFVGKSVGAIDWCVDEAARNKNNAVFAIGTNDQESNSINLWNLSLDGPDGPNTFEFQSSYTPFDGICTNIKFNNFVSGVLNVAASSSSGFINIYRINQPPNFSLGLEEMSKYVTEESLNQYNPPQIYKPETLIPQ
ncbi:MAG: hypothetical protein EZS28_046955, partial [Streblomastix strix]